MTPFYFRHLLACQSSTLGYCLILRWTPPYQEQLQGSQRHGLGSICTLWAWVRHHEVCPNGVHWKMLAQYRHKLYTTPIVPVHNHIQDLLPYSGNLSRVKTFSNGWKLDFRGWKLRESREMTLTRPLIIMPPYSMKIFAVKTFANCPKSTKFANFSPAKDSCYMIYSPSLL